MFKDVNPPIWDRALFERIQSKRKKIRRKTTNKGERNMFSGLVVCADCGSNLGYHFNQGNPEITYFNCTGYNRGSRKICNSTHYIRTDFLEQVVLGEIRRMTKFAMQYENEFAKIVMGNSIKAAELDSEQSKAVTSDMFLSSVRKYTRAKKLTPSMLNELIEKIEVHQSEKIDGKTVQRIKIHYNCIGEIDIPDLIKLPENTVLCSDMTIYMVN